MPKVTVYLPDELYDQARARGLPLSALVQQAVRDALAVAGTRDWVEGVRSRPPRVAHRVDTLRAVDDGRDAFGA